MRLQDFRVLSFDCYGTLIDWETGIWNALQPLLADHHLHITREDALAAFGKVEPEVEHAMPHLLYREILERVHGELARLWHLPSSPDLNRQFGESIGNWPAFADTPAALKYLKQHFKLVILSNVDRSSFISTNARLGVEFDAICTAEDIGSYKPDHRNFAYLLDQVGALGNAPAHLLHVAQSLFHDIEPAEALGIHRCWINRRGDTSTGSGATRAIGRMPALDFSFRTLGELAAAHASERD
jgi:2-haloacid dehalogenase